MRLDKVGHSARRVVRGNPQALAPSPGQVPCLQDSIHLFKPRFSIDAVPKAIHDKSIPGAATLAPVALSTFDQFFIE